ncbi:glycosyltransferase family 4 protein [Rhodococcus pyridinivorans]|uniref:glycosyltransferase family 4 protein n=1 Tax=Rhodococcus pyridinivorans TaxID=103816 RepID=UPI002078DFE8|nr:glycosyltransferase family 4 protein [Rhodococcus pyridinivorans]USI91353.1 glycosyltransferase family 4 protein [Rhodococcus pyridinivorans]
MTKILFITHTAAPSGAEIATARLARALRDLGVYVAVAYAQDGAMAQRMRADGFDTWILSHTFDSRTMTIADHSPTRLLAGTVGLARIGWALGDVATESGATVMIAESSKALLMGAVAARRAKIPLVWHVHDRVSPEYFGHVLAPIVRILGRLLSCGYIANSRSTMSSLLPRRRALVAYPGVESAPIAARAEQRDPAETIVTVVGRLTAWKGQDVFLHAAANTTVRPSHIYLVGGTFFGEESYHKHLEQLSDELGLPVTFTGHVDDPEEYMRRADILVHCSVLAEPFGQVVVEGMRAGCAVIASRPGGPTEIIESGVNGLLVEGGDRRALTAALDTLIGDRELRCRLAAAGIRRAVCFDIAESARAVAHFLRAVGAPSDTEVSAAWSRNAG